MIFFMPLHGPHGPTNWNSWKIELVSLCGFSRFWWKMEWQYTQFGSIRSNFLATLIFDNLKNQKFDNLSKTVTLVKIFQRSLTKIINLVKKVMKNRHFLVIFSTKTRYCSLDSLGRGIKVGSKMKYNCYILQIQVLKFFIWFWWGDIRVRRWNLVKNRNFDLFDKGWFLSSKWSNLIDYSIKWTLT